MTDCFIGSGGQGEERTEDDSQVASLRKWGPADPDLTHRHLLIMVVGTGDWTLSPDYQLPVAGTISVCSLLSSQ